MKIKLFKKSQGCIPCQTLANHLDSHGIEYEAIEAFDQPEEAMKYGIRKVPTLVVGEKVIAGLKLEEINKELGI